METNNKEQDTPVIIQPRAGTTRGVRIWPDPDGIFFSPFEEAGQKLGYIFVYGEEEPAVFDGKTWHPILEGDTKWEDMQEAIINQYYTIATHSQRNPAYKDIAQRLMAGAQVTG